MSIRQIVEEIGFVTNQMYNAFESENYEEMEKLLETRQNLFLQADEYMRENQGFQYDAGQKEILAQSLSLDRKLAAGLKENLAVNSFARNELKERSRATEGYSSYQNQTSGAFLDLKIGR